MREILESTTTAREGRLEIFTGGIHAGFRIDHIDTIVLEATSYSIEVTCVAGPFEKTPNESTVLSICKTEIWWFTWLTVSVGSGG